MASRPHLSPDQHALQLKRLKDACDQIPDLWAPFKTANSADFDTWHERVKRTLEAAFGSDARYFKDFVKLRFSEPRYATITSYRFADSKPARPNWDQQDQKAWDEAWPRAKALLADAIGELEAVSPQSSDATAAEPLPTRHSPPTFILQNYTILQSTTNITTNQILEVVNNLELPEAERAEARGHVEAFNRGVKEKQPMTVLGKSIDALKALGSAAYKEVGLPLLLAYIKSQSGLP